MKSIRPYPAGFFERGSLVTGVSRLCFFCAGIPAAKRPSSKMNIIMKCSKRKVLVHWKLFVQLVQERCKKAKPGGRGAMTKGCWVFAVYRVWNPTQLYLGIIISHYLLDPYEPISTRWFKVTFWSPSWRSRSHLKGSLNHPKKVTLNHQVYIMEWHKSFEHCSDGDLPTELGGDCT